MDPSYNNSFGSQAPIVSGPISSGTISSGSTGSPAGSVPLSSGTGDIILGSGKQAKSKKPILIAAIGVVVVLAVTVAILAIMTLSKPATARELFNEYANYLLFGTESRADLPDDDYEWGKLYYAGKQRIFTTSQSNNGDDTRRQYLDELKNKYEKFKKSASPDVLAEYDDSFYMFYYIYRHPVATYTKNSTEDEILKIKEQYNIYINSSNEAVQEYGRTLMQSIDSNEQIDKPIINNVIIKIFSKLWKMKEAIYAQE